MGPNLLLGALSGLIAVLAFLSGLLEGPELLALDFRHLLRFALQREASEAPIVVVAIDDPSIRALGRWPWPRAYHGALIDTLSRSGAATIAVDLLFDSPSSPEDDMSLVQAVRRSGRVVLAAGALGSRRRPWLFPNRSGAVSFNTFMPMAELRSASLGHTGVFVDSDGILRRIPLRPGDGEILADMAHSSSSSGVESPAAGGNTAQDTSLPPFALQAVRLYKAQRVATGEPGPPPPKGLTSPLPSDLLISFRAGVPSRDGRDGGGMDAETGAGESTDADAGQTVVEKPEPGAVPKTNPAGQAGAGTISETANIVPVGASPVSTSSQTAPTLPTLSSSRLFPTISYSDVLQGRFRRGDVLSKLVFVGVTASSIPGDRFLTPLRGLGPVPGVLVHASAARTLLTGDFIERQDRLRSAAAILLIGAVSGAIFGRLAGIPLAVSLVVLLGATWSWITTLFVTKGLWVELVPSSLALALSFTGSLVKGYTLERREKARLRSSFERYVSSEVVERILSDHQLRGPGGERRNVTVLFADLRAFTTFSERVDTAVVTAVLNRHLETMAEAVFEHGGTLDKFTGDGLMAIFGAPLPQADHAQKAVEAGWDILRRVAELRRQCTADDEDALDVGVGVNTGEALVGNIGTARRLDYTAVGDTVNVAARLQELAGPGELLIGESTRMAAGPRVDSELYSERTLTGRRQPVKVYRVRGIRRYNSVNGQIPPAAPG